MNPPGEQDVMDRIGNRRFFTVLPCDAAPLRDHRVHGQGVLPGVFLIDLVLRSLRDCGVDVTGVEPMTGVTPMRLKRREDVVTTGEMADRILSNAPDAREGFFAVPKVVE